MVAGNVAGQEGQAGYADGGEVVVVACLPGALVGIGEVVDLHEVDQEGVAAVDIGKAGIAAHLLVGEADLVAVQAVAEHAVPGLVVDLAGVGRTAVLAQTHAQVGAQFTGPYGLFGEQAEEVLAVDVVEVGEVIAAGDLVAEPIVDTGQIQMIGLGATGEAAVLVVQREVFGIGRGTVDDLVQPPAGEGQALQFLGGQQAAFVDLRQGAAGAGLDHRQLGNVRAVAKFGLGELDLGSQSQAAELVRGAAVLAHRQQVGAAAAAARIELDAEHAQRVEPEADIAFGIAGPYVEQEALRPFLTLGLAVAFAEVPVEVDVMGMQGGAAVFDETGLGQWCEGGGRNGQGKTGLRGSADLQHRVSPSLFLLVCGAVPHSVVRATCGRC